MARRGNRIGVDWQTPADSNFQWEHVTVEILMDIRDELRRLNATLNCHRVPAGMDALTRIDRRLANRLPMKPRKARRSLK